MAAQATRRSGRIGLREVRGLGPGEVVWDAGSGAVTGFGARRQRSEAVSFIVVYRTRPRRPAAVAHHRPLRQPLDAG